IRSKSLSHSAGCCWWIALCCCWKPRRSIELPGSSSRFTWSCRAPAVGPSCRCSIWSTFGTAICRSGFAPPCWTYSASSHAHWRKSPKESIAPETAKYLHYSLDGAKESPAGVRGDCRNCRYQHRSLFDAGFKAATALSDPAPLLCSGYLRGPVFRMARRAGSGRTGRYCIPTPNSGYLEAAPQLFRQSVCRSDFVLRSRRSGGPFGRPRTQAEEDSAGDCPAVIASLWRAAGQLRAHEARRAALRSGAVVSGACTRDPESTGQHRKSSSRSVAGAPAGRPQNRVPADYSERMPAFESSADEFSELCEAARAGVRNRAARTGVRLSDRTRETRHSPQ